MLTVAALVVRPHTKSSSCPKSGCTSSSMKSSESDPAPAPAPGQARTCASGLLNAPLALAEGTELELVAVVKVASDWRRMPCG